MNNKTLGSKFEQDFAKYLSDCGYWVHYIEGGAYTGSQSCDLIAAKDNDIYCIDCKTLKNKSGTFSLDRIEENQRLSYKRFEECGNYYFYLAILWENDVYRVWLNDINFNEKSINLRNYQKIAENFYED